MAIEQNDISNYQVYLQGANTNDQKVIHSKKIGGGGGV